MDCIGGGCKTFPRVDACLSQILANSAARKEVVQRKKKKLQETRFIIRVSPGRERDGEKNS